MRVSPEVYMCLLRYTRASWDTRATFYSFRKLTVGIEIVGGFSLYVCVFPLQNAIGWHCKKTPSNIVPLHTEAKPWRCLMTPWEQSCPQDDIFLYLALPACRHYLALVPFLPILKLSCIQTCITHPCAAARKSYCIWAMKTSSLQCSLLWEPLVWKYKEKLYSKPDQNKLLLSHCIILWSCLYANASVILIKPCSSSKLWVKQHMYILLPREPEAYTA